MIKHISRVTASGVNAVTLTGFDTAYSDILIKGRIDTTYNTSNALFITPNWTGTFYNTGELINNSSYFGWEYQRTNYAELGYVHSGQSNEETDIEIRVPSFSTSAGNAFFVKMSPEYYGTNGIKTARHVVLTTSNSVTTSLQIAIGGGNFTNTYFDIYLID